jgi:hypothetical protein
LDDFAGEEHESSAGCAFGLMRKLFIRSGIEEAMDKACPPSKSMIF